MVGTLMAERETANLVGWYVRELMARKRVRNQEVLAAMVTEAGYPISQPALSKILGGKTEASRGFSRALVVALDLDPDERREWADLFALGETSSRTMSRENYESIKEVRARVRREASPEEGDRENGPGGLRDNRA